MFIICMYQIVEIMRFCKVGENTEFNSHRVYLIRLKAKKNITHNHGLLEYADWELEYTDWELEYTDW